MNDTVRFLTALGQVFSALGLYGREHPMRASAIAKLIEALSAVLATGEGLTLSFLDNEVVVGTRILTDLRGWEWGARLAAAGVQRLEISARATPTESEIESMLGEMRARLSTPGEEFRPWSMGSIRLGPITIASADPSPGRLVRPCMSEAFTGAGLSGEIDAVGYIHDEVAAGHGVPMAEVEAIVRSLALTIRREQAVILPLLDLRTYDEYTTTHSCNVAMLSMGLSEALGVSESDVRAIGAAALLHDIGKVRIPREVLTKEGKLTPEERDLMNAHPVEGAKILSGRGLGHGLAATVAYEHHIWYNGQGGYPGFRFPRTTHFASRIVHVCDIYDALCSRRPYRAAWPREKALGLLHSISGVELDPVVAGAFIAMARAATEERQTLADAAA